MNPENNSSFDQPDYSFILGQQTNARPSKTPRKKIVILAISFIVLIMAIGISVFSGVKKGVQQEKNKINNHKEIVDKFIYAIQSDELGLAYSMVTQENKNTSLAEFDTEMSSRLRELIHIDTCTVGSAYMIGSEGFVDISCETKKTKGLVTFEIRTTMIKDQITISGVNMKKFEQKT